MGLPFSRGLVVLALLSSAFLFLSSGVQFVHAGPYDFNVTVVVSGLPSFYSTRVFADGSLKGTVSGGGSLVVYFTDPGAGVAHRITVDRYVPWGYPYYGGYPYYMGYYTGYYGAAFYAPIIDWTWTGTLPNGTSNTFTYYPIYYLSVQSEHGHARGSGWYLAGTLAPISVESVADERAGTRYRFNRWDGGPVSRSATEPTNYVFMDAPKMVTALWITQHLLTITSQYGEPIGGGWYDSGSTATLSVTSPVSGDEGVRYVFTGWDGDYKGTNAMATLSITKPMSVIANWKTQYWVIVDPAGGQVDQSSQWVDKGDTFTITATSPSAVVEMRSRLVFVGWSGAKLELNPTVSIVVNAPLTLKANWKTQYYMSVTTLHSSAEGEGWYDAGSVATYSLKESRVPYSDWLASFGARYVFAHWEGDVQATDPSGAVVVDSPKALRAVWAISLGAVYLTMAVLAFGILVLVWKRGLVVQRARPFVGKAFGPAAKKAPPKVAPAPSKKSVPKLKAIPSAKLTVLTCSKCGTKRYPNADFCIECGEAFERSPN